MRRPYLALIASALPAFSALMIHASEEVLFVSVPPSVGAQLVEGLVVRVER